MKLWRWMGCIGLGVVLACAQDQGSDGAEERAAEVPAESRAGADTPADTIPGVIHGVVRDAATDLPVSGALVTAGAVATTSDLLGEYRIAPLPPGPVRLNAYQRGFRAESTTVVVVAGELRPVDLPLRPSEPPCCVLEGHWDARFSLDSAGLNASPTARRATGRLAFDEMDEKAVASRVASWTGTSAIEFGPLLGAGAAARVAEAAGEVFHGDSVAVTLLPSFGDWAIELRGRQVADTVRGDWFQRASCCGAYGSFVLVRDPDGWNEPT